MGCQIFDQVWNTVGKITVWNRVRVSRSVPHTPSQFFWKYPPRISGTQKVGHCARRSLRRPRKLRLRIFAWSKPRTFCEENVGKIKFRAFPKRAGPRILSLESVDYFGASEHYWVVEKKRILISKIAMVGCCTLSLYENESWIFVYLYTRIGCYRRGIFGRR